MYKKLYDHEKIIIETWMFFPGKYIPMGNTEASNKIIIETWMFFPAKYIPIGNTEASNKTIQYAIMAKKWNNKTNRQAP